MNHGHGVDHCNGSKGARPGFGNSTDNGLGFAQCSTVLMGRKKKKGLESIRQRRRLRHLGIADKTMPILRCSMV